MKFLNFCIFFLLLIIYYPWISLSGTFSSGDWPYLFIENVKEFTFIPRPGSIWLSYYYEPGAKIFVEYLGFSWEIAERLLWFWPFLILSIASSYYFTKSWIGVLLYTANTYILMVAGGGQMGVAMAYSIAPLVFGQFLKLIQNPSVSDIRSGSMIKKSVVAGLILSIQLIFDPRIAFITVFGVASYMLISVTGGVRFSRFIITVSLFMLTILFSLILNIFWIIPLIKNGTAEVAGFILLPSLEYFSFAKLEQTISLLHPNWPENIFGKVYFMRGEFLLIPIIAFLSLLFIQNVSRKEEKLKIVYFSLLALIGSFLAKGANEPFGEFNKIIFEWVPGFQMFRDPTKWYVLIAISYSYLIPRSILFINDYMYKTFSKNIFKLKINPIVLRSVIGIFFLGYFTYLSRQAVIGQLSGTFKTRPVPFEYIKLKNTINQPQYFSTLWILKYQRFGLSISNHQAFDGQEYFIKNSVEEVLHELKRQDTYQKLTEDSVKYVIVPFDSEHEIFIDDRKYSERLYNLTISEVKKIIWLKELPGFEKVKVFEVMRK